METYFQSSEETQNLIGYLLIFQVKMNINSNLCVIYNEYLHEQLSLVTKGLTSLISSCDILGKTELSQYLRSIRDEGTLEPTPVYIHSSCRKTIYNRVKSVNNKSHNDVSESPRPT